MPTRRRLAIAVTPRLLGDALSRILAHEDRDVLVIPSEPSGTEEEGRFDIALVSGDDEGVPASVVIRLPDSPTLDVALVGGESVPLDDLAGLVALVERCSAAIPDVSPVENGA